MNRRARLSALMMCAASMLIITSCGSKSSNKTSTKDVTITETSSKKDEKTSSELFNNAQKNDIIDIETVIKELDKLTSMSNANMKSYQEVVNVLKKQNVTISDDISGQYKLYDPGETGQPSIALASVIISKSVETDGDVTTVKYITRTGTARIDSSASYAGSQAQAKLKSDEYAYLNKEATYQVAISADKTSASVKLLTPDWWKS